MNHVQQISVTALCFVGLLVACSAAPAAEQTPMRVAVVDTGDKPAVPTELLDLLVAHLSQREGLSLLERQEINTILQEQERTISLAENAAQDSFITAGRILGADALVLISASPANQQGLLSIEARVVETRRGIRFGETVLSWSKEKRTNVELVQAAIEQIESRLQRVQSAKGEFTVVSLAGFQTDELSQEAHQFKRSLESWLKSWLSSQPGIAVAERTKVLPLIRERKLASDLPKALGNADATINGTFKLDFSEEQPRVELTLRVVRKSHSVAKKTLKIPIHEDAKLRISAGQAVLELFELDPVNTSFDAKTEALHLTNESKRLLALWRRYEALDRLIAAHALDPDSVIIQSLLMQAGSQLGANVDRSGASFEGPFYPTALFLCDVARQLLDRAEQGRVADGASFERSNLLGLIGDLCKLVYSSQFVVKQPSESDLIYHEWLRVATDDLYRRYLALSETEGGQTYEAAIYKGLQFGRYWAKDPEDALNQRFQLFSSAAQLLEQKRLGSFGNWAFVGDHRFRLTDNKDWAKRNDLAKLYDAYFRKMQESGHVAVQAVGEREAANYSLWILNDKNQAMVHYRRFIRLIVDEIVPNHPELADEVHALWLHLNHKTGYLALTDEEAGKLWGEVILARWSHEKRCPKASQPWEYRIKKTMLHLEKAGLINEANHLVQACIEALVASPVDMKPDQVSSQWQETLGRLRQLKQGLAERHPQLGKPSEQLPTVAVKCQSLLHFEQLPEVLAAQEIPVYSWNFAGMVATEDGYAVACRAQAKLLTGKNDRFQQREWIAIVRFNKQGDVQSTSLFPEPFSYDYRRSRIDNGMQKLRPLATTGENLFLAVPSNGIIWFQLEEEPIHFSSKYLERQDTNRHPVPFEEARQLLPIDGKLYLASGDVMHPVVYELDYHQAKATTLLDARNLARDSPLWGRTGFAITEGTSGELLIWALPDIPELTGGHLFRLRLSDHSVRQAKRSFRVNIPWVRSGPRHHLCIQTQEGGLGVFDPRTLSMKWLLANQSTPSLPSQSSTRLHQREFVVNGRFLLTATKKRGGVSAREWRLYTRGAPQSLNTTAFVWLLYENGDLNPRQLVADDLPSPDDVLQYLMDDQGQITMMTRKELFRVNIPSRQDH